MQHSSSVIALQYSPAIRRTQISAKKKGPPFSSPKLLEGTAPHMTTVQP